MLGPLQAGEGVPARIGPRKLQQNRRRRLPPAAPAEHAQQALQTSSSHHLGGRIVPQATNHGGQGQGSPLSNPQPFIGPPQQSHQPANTSPGAQQMTAGAFSSCALGCKRCDEPAGLLGNPGVTPTQQRHSNSQAALSHLACGTRVRLRAYVLNG
eukprot:scaffold438215_cov36-Prasinocladus_malaysianus.AAC.1